MNKPIIPLGLLLTSTLTVSGSWAQPVDVAAAPSDEAGGAVRFAYELPERQVVTNLQIPSIDISRDGRRIAYSAAQQIFVRNLDVTDARAVEGASGAVFIPRFSPDGQRVAFVQGPSPFSIRTIPVGGGTAQTVLEGLTAPPYGLDWGEDDMLLFIQPEGVRLRPHRFRHGPGG